MIGRRRGRTGVAAVLAGVVSLVFASVAAAHDEPRGYELVSSSAKNGSAIGAAQVAPDGTRVLLQQSSADVRLAVSTREALAGGKGLWHQVSMAPPRSEMANDANYGLVAATRDRTQEVFFAQKGLLQGAPPVTLVRLDTAGRQTTLATVDAFHTFGTLYAAISAAGDHVFFNLQQTFEPGHVAGTQNVYDVSADPPLLVSRLPDGSVPACGTPGFIKIQLSSSERQNWVSANGSHVFFGSRGNGNCATDPLRLYRREIGSGTTTLISGPVFAGPEADATFLQASADGEAVVFVTSAALTPDDTNSDPDVYRWTSSTGSECLTCSVGDANVSDLSSFEQSVAVSEDLSHVYFTSQNQLTPDAPSGAAGLYVWHGGTIDYIAPAAGIAVLINNPGYGGELTPDGNVLVFSSDDPGMDSVATGGSNGGTRQYYRYDDQDGSVTCMSCSSAGGSVVGVASPLAAGDVAQVGYVQMLSDDGSRFVFRTLSALVPEDVNVGSDIYEWHDGQVRLITGGVSFGGPLSRSAAIPRGMSADGTDVFFTSFEKLTPEAGDEAMQLYDARLGGGEPVRPGSARCEGDGCQGQPSAPPVLPVLGSAALTLPSVSGGGGGGRFTVAGITGSQRAALARSGRLRVVVRVTTTGLVSATLRARVHGRTSTVAHAARRASGAGSLRLLLTLSRAARRQLAVDGRLRLVLTVGYSKAAAVVHRTLLLRAPANVVGR